jgi:hypothetical protein
MVLEQAAVLSREWAATSSGRLTTACRGRRFAPPLMLSVQRRERPHDNEPTIGAARHGANTAGSSQRLTRHPTRDRVPSSPCGRRDAQPGLVCLTIMPHRALGWRSPARAAGCKRPRHTGALGDRDVGRAAPSAAHRTETPVYRPSTEAAPPQSGIDHGPTPAYSNLDPSAHLRGSEPQSTIQPARYTSRHETPEPVPVSAAAGYTAPDSDRTAVPVEHSLAAVGRQRYRTHFMAVWHRHASLRASAARAGDHR